MADATAKPRLVRIAELFERYGVEFIVLGGEAAVLHGSPLPTFDTDLCYRRTPENLKRLAEALTEIHPTLDDLIAIKRHIHRPKDQAALFQLEAIKQLREGLKR